MIFKLFKKNPLFRAKDALKEYKKRHEESERLIEDREGTLSTLDSAEQKFQRKKGGVLQYLKEDIQLTFELIRSYIRKDYKKVPKKTIVALLGAVIYLVSPIDVVLDFIPGLGYMDDAFVLGYVIKQVASDLQDFKVWKYENHYETFEE